MDAHPSGGAHRVVKVNSGTAWNASASSTPTRGAERQRPGRQHRGMRDPVAHLVLSPLHETVRMAGAEFHRRDALPCVVVARLEFEGLLELLAC